MSDSPTRRDFFKSAAAASALPIAASAHAAGTDTIRIGVIGCGGRGYEASMQAMGADKGVRLVAMADMLMERIHEKRDLLRRKFPEQTAVDDDRCFTGFDAYKNVIESVDVVLIANAAKFHPFHMTAAIDAGKHVFVEKPHAIDPAGIKIVRACLKARVGEHIRTIAPHQQCIAGPRRLIHNRGRRAKLWRDASDRA